MVNLQMILKKKICFLNNGKKHADWECIYFPNFKTLLKVNCETVSQSII